MAEADYDPDRLATIFGGSGFVGRHIVRALAGRGWRVRVAVRRPDLAAFLQPIGGVGQVQAVQANLRYPASIATALAGASLIVNAAGVKAESGAQTYGAVHIDGAEALAKAAAQAGVEGFVHISGIGVDANSDSAYVASKALGEQATLAAFPSAVVLRPSVIFGPEDEFFNRLAALARLFVVLPLPGGGATRLQPVYVGDVAKAAAAALDGAARPGTVYELGGPEIMTLRQAAHFVLGAIGRRRLVVGMPLGLARLAAGVSEFATRASFGLYPQVLRMTRDQVDLLGTDNLVSAAAVAEGRDLKGLGVVALGAEAIAPAYLSRFRKTGPYELRRQA